MVFELQSLLDLRRDAESAAKRTLDEVSVDLRRQEEELARLSGRTRAAEERLESETRRMDRGAAPTTAEQGRARERYLGRLRDRVGELRYAESEHAKRILAAAQASHRAALSRFEVAVRDRKAVSKLADQARASASKTAARRAEDAATDLANVRLSRRSSDR
jgi:flagellar export protein FliJ